MNFMKTGIKDHLKLAEALADQTQLMQDITDAAVGCINHGGCIYLAGNGGSAADAQHIAAELVGRFKVDRAALPAIALTTDTSTLTAVCNDLGAEQAFSRQVEALVTHRDIFWALSVSGSSPNVVRAAQTAKDRGATIIGFTSRLGDALAQLCDYCLKVDHDQSDRVQEIHQLAYHLICERIEQAAQDGTITPRGSSSQVTA